LVPSLSSGGKAAGASVDHPPHLAPKLKKEQSYTSNPLWAFMACCRVTFTNDLPLKTLDFVPTKCLSVCYGYQEKKVIVSLYGIKEGTLFSVRYELSLYLTCIPDMYNILAEFCVHADNMKFSTQNVG
jgi:hypothetical protein